MPDETIVEDYALSAAAMVRLLEHLKAEYPDAAEEVERHAPAILKVMPETMEEFLAAIGSRVRQLRGPGRVARGRPMRWAGSARRCLSPWPEHGEFLPGARRSVGRIGPCPASSTRRNSM